MIVLLTIIAIVIAGVPFAAVVLVTIASRREDNAGSIGGRAPGGTERAARRLLAFHATGIGRPACRARARGQRPGSGRSAGDDRHRACRIDRSGRTDSADRTNRSGRTRRARPPGPDRRLRGRAAAATIAGAREGPRAPARPGPSRLACG